MESILNPSYWPVSLSNFVTWCLMWDPKNRPTSAQALNHEYFTDAVDPTRPRSSTSRLLGRKQSDRKLARDAADYPTLTSKPSWFRKSLISKPEATSITSIEVDQCAGGGVRNDSIKTKMSKRGTWATGAPMAILPSVRPVSPLSNAVTAQAKSAVTRGPTKGDGEGVSKKIGRQLSLNSHGNHYADVHRQEAEKALNGGNGVSAAGGAGKEGFFSHLRKRARRLSGRNSLIINNNDGSDMATGCIPWSNRSSLMLDATNPGEGRHNTEAAELDRILQNVRSTLYAPPVQITSASVENLTQNKRSSMPAGSTTTRSVSESAAVNPSSSSRTRRAMQMTGHPVHRYETPEEEDELMDEALQSGKNPTEWQPRNPYATPSPSGDNVHFTEFNKQAKVQQWNNPVRQWPTPPYEEEEWTRRHSAAQLFGVTSEYR